MLRAGRDTVDTCLPVHHLVVAAVDAGERHPYRPLGVERFQRGRCERRFGRVERASRDGVRRTADDRTAEEGDAVHMIGQFASDLANDHPAQLQPTRPTGPCSVATS